MVHHVRRYFTRTRVYLLAAKYEVSVPGQLPYTGVQTNDCLYDADNYQQVKRSFDKHFNDLIHSTVK